MPDDEEENVMVLMALRIVPGVEAPNDRCIKDKCSNCGVPVWNTEDDGRAAPRVGPGGIIERVARPAGLVVVCGPCAYDLARAAGDERQIALVKKVVEEKEGMILI
jgi:hypothetical protein